MIFNQAKSIYKTLAKANGFYIRPWLHNSDDMEINAYNHHLWITLNRGACEAYNVDEMAFMLAHELGHFKFRHIFKLGNAYDREYEADRLAAQYMANAGFNTLSGIKILLKKNAPATGTHPASLDRYNALKYGI